MTSRGLEGGRERDAAERKLVARAQRGDRDAIDEMVRRFWAPAYRVGYLIAQDSHAAEDIAQEAMFAAMNSLASFDKGRRFEPWIQGIAAHKAHDWVRRRSRRPEVLLDEGTATIEAADQIAEDIARDFGESDVGRALRRLDLTQREAVVLRHLLCYSPQEVADVTGLPAATVRTRIFRGLARLRAEIAGERKDSDELSG